MSAIKLQVSKIQSPNPEYNDSYVIEDQEGEIRIQPTHYIVNKAYEHGTLTGGGEINDVLQTLTNNNNRSRNFAFNSSRNVLSLSTPVFSISRHLKEDFMSRETMMMVNDRI